MTAQDDDMADNKMITTQEESAVVTEEDITSSKPSVSWADGADSTPTEGITSAAGSSLPLSPEFSEEGSTRAAVMDENIVSTVPVLISTNEVNNTDTEVATDSAPATLSTNGGDTKPEAETPCSDFVEKTQPESDGNKASATMTPRVEDAGTQNPVSVATLEETIVEETVATAKVEVATLKECTSLPTTSGSVLLPPSLRDDSADEVYMSRSEDSGDAIVVPMLTLSVSADDEDDGVILPPSYSDVGSPISNNNSKTSGAAASLLLSLPIDSLHCVASFLTPLEWSQYGQTCSAAAKVCREIFRRVRMHGFRCATEVVMAWKLEHLADAKELAALYIATGVPIYPHSLGHSYHTVCWRMGLEAKKLNQEADAEAEQNNPTNNSSDRSVDEEVDANAVDRFYTERDTRARDATNVMCSYLEDKAMFYVGPTQTNAPSPMSGRWSSLASLPAAANREQPAVPAVIAAGGADAPPVPRPLGFRPASPLASPARSMSQSDLMLKNRAPKVPVSIHRHLLDQHLLGRSFVNDENGEMKTPPVILSADFFHPHLSVHNISANNRPLSHPATPPPRTLAAAAAAASSTSGATGENLMQDPAFQAWAARAAANVYNRLGGNLEDAEELAELQDLYSQIFAVDRSAPPAAADPENGVPEQPAAQPPVAQLPPPPAVHFPFGSPQRSIGATSLDDSLLSPGLSRHGQPSPILNSVDLAVYSASAGNAKDNTGKTGETKRNLRSRFTFYQRRLEVLLLHGDSSGYEECMLDFWDEFFPLSAKIQYYDRHTAVPRISGLQQFLTQPCPKEIGIVQCEIERVKISSKKRKGVSMKGRLFPTYEYRLFIKDRQHSKATGEGADSTFTEDTGIRRDTVLMVAKNRGRKHVDTSGVVSLTPAAKKGANNYYLYTPQQADVDTHFNSINETDEEVTGNINGVSMSTPPPSSLSPPVLLGRLQSNFIGTEFQIYTPKLRKSLPSGKQLRRCTSLNEAHGSYDEDADYESGAASDTGTPSSRRRSRFGRLTLRRSSSHATSASSSDPALNSPSPSRARSRSRSRSQKETSTMRALRMNRRAIANLTDAAPEGGSDTSINHQPFLCEEEDGVITYTANLLGSRPRIMDVCIPKLTTDGSIGGVWRNYLENNEDVDDCAPYNRMLNCFKQLQQHLESQNDNEGDGQNESEDDDQANDDFGLLALQNRPPWWNIELGSFVLNFRGRVSVASVKNFQLCDRNDHDHIMLQFGRIQGRHSFTMDYQYPLTAVQAFSIAISSLQSKISFG
ncbi:Protein king tubby [Seminavis robusta]|uniref:Protein king tubby n=1 Tax=Seminavis robusta TaxID=568900 RepID=A0A9N8HIJ8_9STRA|nr:Protein king tubby [Seminavis robusta]|eukprot:Sro702_g189880.1 Protein king tubby (1265) ;mRNA; r:5128-9008